MAIFAKSRLICPFPHDGVAALYKGDTRTRTIDVYVDDAKITTWTSSGTNAGFESFGLDTQGQVIELRATDSEWLSILEVRSFRRV